MRCAGTGDFNGYGKSDILFQNANGQLAIWYMNGSTVLPGSGNVYVNPGSSWHVAAGTGG
jgi:serralysin